MASGSARGRVDEGLRPTRRWWTWTLWLGACLAAVMLAWCRGRAGAVDETAGVARDAGPATAGVATGVPDDRSTTRAAGPLLREGSIAGIVRDDAGAAIGGAWVCASSDIHAPPTCEAADAKGHYRISLRDAAPLRVHASANGFTPGFAMDGPRPATIVLAADEARIGVDLVLARGGVEVRGIVTDVLGGPIEGASITIALPREAIDVPEQWRIGAPAHARSDEDGRFLAWAQSGTWAVQARAPGYADAVQQVDVPRGTVEIAMVPEASIAGIVMMRATRAPVAHARVVLREWKNGVPSDRTVGYADGEGRFRIGALAPGRYRPMAVLDSMHGEAPQSFTLDLAESVDDAVIELVESATVLGSVVVAPSSSPCLGGFVRLVDGASENSLVATIESDGKVVFEGVLPARYDVVVGCDGHTSEHAERVLVVEGSGAHETTWIVEKGRTVRGRVLDDEGKPRAARIIAFTASGAGDGLARIGSAGLDGRFEIAGFGSGPHALSASTPEGGDAEVTVDIDRDDVEIELRMAASAGLTGTIRRDGVGLAGVQVRARSEERGRSFRQSVSDDEGRFRFDGMVPGRHIVSASDDAEVRLDERTVELVVHQGSTVDLVAPATAAIRGVVLDADGSPVAEAVVSALATTALSSPEQRAEALRDRSAAGSKGSVLSDAEGRFTLPGLVAASTYTVLAQRRGGGVARAEAVATGGAIELHLQALASLHGQVTGVAAVSGLSVELRRSDAGTRLRESFVLDGGHFTFDKLAPGAYDVVAVAREGRGQAHVELVAGRDAILSVALVANRTLRGRFVELGTGAPLQDVVAVVGDDAAGPTEQAAKAEQLLQTRPAGLLSSGDGLFTVPDSPSATIHLLAISADIAGTDPSIVEFIVIAPTDGADGLLEIPLVRRRSGTKGKLGVELEIPMYCSDTPTVARVDDTLAGVDVRVGDEVAAIDGHDVTGRRCYLARQLMAAAPGAAVRLTLARGGEIELHGAAAP